jgi:hypothetical protein
LAIDLVLATEAKRRHQRRDEGGDSAAT